MPNEYVQYYWLEQYLFTDVRRHLRSEHSIGAFDLFSIIIWKANRAKTLIVRRLIADHGSLERAARAMSKVLWEARTPQARLELLLTDWKFRLPMASAILTVLWPDDFTVYDESVCGQLGDFARLGGCSSSRIWAHYCAFRDAVRKAAPANLSLRGADRYLWGRSATAQLEADLKAGFGRVER